MQLPLAILSLLLICPSPVVVVVAAPHAATFDRDLTAGAPRPWRQLSDAVIRKIWNVPEKPKNLGAQPEGDADAHDQTPGRKLLALYGGDMVLRFTVRTPDEATALAEAARILSPGGYLFHLPVVPSPASKVLELLFRFKAHSPAEVTAATERHFRVLHEYHFPFPDPIGWTKVAVLSQKL